MLHCYLNNLNKIWTVAYFIKYILVESYHSCICVTDESKTESYISPMIHFLHLIPHNFSASDIFLLLGKEN